MNFNEAINMIKCFWNHLNFPFGSDISNEVLRLEKEFPIEMPDELKEYLSNYAPDRDYPFEAVGNPILLYSPKNISSRLDGYNWNPVKLQEMEGWKSSWGMFGEEGETRSSSTFPFKAKVVPFFKQFMAQVSGILY